MSKQPQSKKIWRKNFEIRRTHVHMATAAMYDVLNYTAKPFNGILKEVFWSQQDYDNIGSYFPVNELREFIDKTMEAIQKNPERIEKIHKETTKYSKECFAFGKSVLKMDLKKLSNAELAKVHNRLTYLQQMCHGYSQPSTWFVDSDGEDFSKFLMKQLEDIIKAGKSSLSLAEAFNILTTPDKPSLAIIEEIESLKILNEIKVDDTARKIFGQNDIAKIEKELEKINQKLRKKIINHYEKWHWAPYTYIGPAYDFDYYLTAWSGLLREGINIDEHLEKLSNQTKEAKKRKTKIEKELGLDKKTKRLFDIASEIIYLKSYRKDAYFYSSYVLDKIFIEISRRLSLSLKQVRFMAFWEIEPALKKGSFSAKILNERIKFSVLHQKGEKGIIYTGDKARKFLKSLTLEKIEIKEVDHLEGTSACPGKAKGEVKIINVPEEMGKMREGNIMVAHTTFPALVPAMKKASAIVTDDGGITCHAAIVARELKTPCVVGTKIATHVLKDGDIVEVDADKGSIKIIKNL